MSAGSRNDRPWRIHPCRKVTNLYFDTLTMLQHHPGETLIHQLFDAQPDAAVWFRPVFENEDDPHSKLLDFEAHYCNQKAAEILGSTADKIAGSRILSSNIMDAVSRQRILDQCRQVWESGASVEFTYYSPGLDRYLNVQRSKVYNGILSITRDRTREVRMDLERQKQEEHYRQVLDSAADGILVFDAIRDAEGKVVDFKVIHANRRAYEIGALPPDAVGKTMLTLLPHLQGSEQLAWHKVVVETGEPVQFETAFRTPEGREYGWFIVSLVRLGDGVVSNFVDVTRRRQYEEQIEQQNDLLRSVFESTINGMVVCEAVRDSEGTIIDLRIQMVNNAFTQILHLKEESAVGKLYLDVFPAARDNGMFDFNVSVIEKGVPLRSEMYYKGDHIDAWFDNSTSPVAPDGLLIAFNDITARKKLQLELEQKLEELKRSNQSLEEFAYAASHDLQEPLRKIHFFSDRLKGTLNPGSEQASMFDRMESATTRMRDLIDDLLAYSKLSVVPEALSPVDLGQVVQQVLQDLEASVLESGAQIRVDPLPMIQGDERQLRQLFQNLIGNALKYRMEGRTPEISVRFRSTTDVADKKDYFQIEVSDNGIGFEPQYADKIFQVFQRLHGRKEYAGSGVGLAIARKVVANHKGIILAEGRPDAGATFRILMPNSMLIKK
jgi:PAS domain S-box-containing protein